MQLSTLKAELGILASAATAAVLLVCSSGAARAALSTNRPGVAPLNDVRAVGQYPVVVDVNGIVVIPTNFYSANSNALGAAVSGLSSNLFAPNALAATNLSGLQSSNDVAWRLSIPANYCELAEPTPRMGWISWPNAGSGINESMVKQVADIFYTNNLSALGYKWVIVDDSWGYMISKPTQERGRTSNVATIKIDGHSFATGDKINVTGMGGTGYNASNVTLTSNDFNHFSYSNTGSNEGTTADTGGTVTRTNFNYRDANGFVRVDTNRFPHCVDGVGMKYLADYCHARGLKFGLQASAANVSQGAMVGCTNVLKDGQAFGIWGIDYIKRDNVGDGDDPDFTKCRNLVGSWLKHRNPPAPVAFYVRFVDNDTGGVDGTWEPWMSEVFTERLNYGIADPSVQTWTNMYVHFIRSVTNNAGWTGPGHYAAADWMQFSGGNPEDYYRGRSWFTLYSMASIPIELGSAFYNLTNGSGVFEDYWGQIYTNAAVIAIDQDPAVIPCYALATNTFTNQVWVKPLGSRESQVRAVAFVNGHGSNTSTMGCALADIGIYTNLATVIDCWSNTFAWVTNTISGSVNPHDVRCWKVTAGLLPWPSTYAWGGPTNVVEAIYPFQTYTATTPMSITSVSAPPTGFGTVRLMVTNAAATNVTLFFPANLVTLDGARTYTVTNGQEASFAVTFYGGHAQGEFKAFYAGMDSDAVAFFSRASISDGTQQSAINTLVASLKGHGIWTKLDALYPFVGGSATPHSKNLIANTYNITWNGSPTHNSSGVTGDASTAYGDTGFNPSTAGGQMTQNSASIFVYVGSATADSTAIGVVEGTHKSTIERISPSWFGKINDQATGLGRNASGEFRGPLLVSRTGSSVNTIYFGGSTIGSDASTGLPNANIYVLAENNGGLWKPLAGSLRAAGFGSSLSSTDWTNLAADLDAYELALSRKVP